MTDMPRPRPPHLHREQSRHGSVVWYVRRGHGPRIRLRAEYGSEEFWIQYRGALEGAAPSEPSPSKARPHSLRWAVEKYRTRSEWTGLSQATRKQRENIFLKVLQTAGDAPLSSITEKAIRDGRERRAGKPHSANNFLKTMRGFFHWAVDEGLVEADPTKGVSLLRGANDDVGFHTWTEDEVERFEAYWPVGTRERLAFDILLYTGLRRGDAVRLGRQHVRDGWITIRAEKTGEPITIPLLPPLQATIEASQTGDLTFIVTEHGKPFVKESFGNWFREACRKAGCPGSAHGLRKAGATRAAENGASDRQLMAIFGWTTSKMATHYTRAAEKKRLAKAAAELLMPARSGNDKLPHLKSSVPAPRKK